MSLDAYAYRFGEAMRWIEHHRSIIDKPAYWKADGPHAGLPAILDSVAMICSEFGWNSINQHVTRTGNAYARAVTALNTNAADATRRVLDQFAADLLSRLEDELAGHKFIWLPPQKLAQEGIGRGPFLLEARSND